MEFTKTVKFLGIEERKMKDGKLYAVTFFGAVKIYAQIYLQAPAE